MSTMNAKLLKTLAIALALALVVAACGSDDDEASDAVEDAAADEPTDDAAADADEASDTEGVVTGDRSEGETEDAAEDSSDDAAAAAPAAEQGGGLFGDAAPPPTEPDDADEGQFEDYGIRPFVETAQDPLSTFALDVDTAAYSIAQRFVAEGSIPPPESVRVEEYVNSFDYDYPAPNDGLTVVADGGPSPYDTENVIVRLGVQAEQVAGDERPPASLTFVVDTSGSMDRADRLGLVKTALETLVRELDDDDVVSIVTYSGDAQVLLEPTSVADAEVILAAIDSLQTTGSTNLEAGLQRGYDLANEAFREGGINRVILASDGVANVGLTDPDALVSLIRGDADRGIQLVTVGVGLGSFNDVVMEQLANDGDGFYAYVNDVAEAERLFSDDLVSTLLTVAIDGKIQVDFDQDNVIRYRLLGYENRAVLDDDFRDDTVDAGELGAGHQTTAIYELTLAPGVGGGDRLGTVQLRWEDPDSGEVIETRLELDGSIVADEWTETAEDFRLAVTVATLAELLRLSPYSGEVTFQQVEEEALALSSGSGPIAELADLVAEIQRLS